MWDSATKIIIYHSIATKLIIFAIHFFMRKIVSKSFLKYFSHIDGVNYMRNPRVNCWLHHENEPSGLSAGCLNDTDLKFLPKQENMILYAPSLPFLTCLYKGSSCL